VGEGHIDMMEGESHSRRETLRGKCRSERGNSKVRGEDGVTVEGERRGRREVSKKEESVEVGGEH